MNQQKILFVCTGNTCRSVIAQALFQKVKDKLAPDLDYRAYSAGIAAIEGVSPTRESIFCIAKYGLDITTHQARQVEERMVKDSSLILTMTQEQQFFLKKQFPWATHKIFLLRPFCRQGNHITNKEIEDPYGKKLSVYERVCEQLEQDIRELIYRLRKDKSK